MNEIRDLYFGRLHDRQVRPTFAAQQYCLLHCYYVPVILLLVIIFDFTINRVDDSFSALDTRTWYTWYVVLKRPHGIAGTIDTVGVAPAAGRR